MFWIDYASVLRFFDVFYLNWNPALFKFTYAVHQEWRTGSSPVKDIYDMSSNPQFRLEVNFPPGITNAAVWALLTRHITDRKDFADNKEYITLLVFKNEGKRVFYPCMKSRHSSYLFFLFSYFLFFLSTYLSTDDPPPFIDGVRINSPLYLCKMLLKASEGSSQRYTLVVSQYEKTNTMYYSLRCYSTVPFRLTKISSTYAHREVWNFFISFEVTRRVGVERNSFCSKSLTECGKELPPVVVRIFLPLTATIPSIRFTLKTLTLIIRFSLR